MSVGVGLLAVGGVLDELVEDLVELGLERGLVGEARELREEPADGLALVAGQVEPELAVHDVSVGHVAEDGRVRRRRRSGGRRPRREGRRRGRRRPAAAISKPAGGRPAGGRASDRLGRREAGVVTGAPVRGRRRSVGVERGGAGAASGSWSFGSVVGHRRYPLAGSSPARSARRGPRACRHPGQLLHQLLHLAELLHEPVDIGKRRSRAGGDPPSPRALRTSDRDARHGSSPG